MQSNNRVSLPRLKDYSKLKSDKLKSFFRTERSTSEPSKQSESHIKLQEFMQKNNLRPEDKKMIETLMQKKEKIVEIMLDNAVQREYQLPKVKLEQLSQKVIKLPTKTVNRSVEDEEIPFDGEESGFSYDDYSEESEDSQEDQYRSYKQYEIQKVIRSVQRKLLPNPQSEYFSFIKKQDRLKDFIQNFKHRDSQNPIFFYCINDELFPKRIDLSNCLIDTKEMNFSSMGVTTKYYPILQKLLQSRKCRGVKQLYLCNNNLTDFTLSLLIPSFPQSLKEINLMNNNLGKRGIHILSQHIPKFPKQFIYQLSLKSINLQNNQLGDGGTLLVLVQLQKRNQLTKVNLAENQITDGVAKNFFSFLVQNSSVEILILNWNRLGGLTGQYIAKGLLQNRSLKVLDISYNRLGQYYNTPNDCIQQWSDAFILPQLSLIHLDISFNQFNEPQLRKLNEALLKNNTIYGLHIEGNKCPVYVDPYGFVQFSLDKDNVNQVQSKQHKINGVSFIPMANEFINGNDCCWICQGWMENRFIYYPDQYTPNITIFLHLDFLDYKPIPMTSSHELRLQFNQQNANKNQELDLTTGEMIHQLKNIMDTDKKISMAAIHEAYCLETNKNAENLQILDDFSKFYYTTYQMCPPKKRVLYFFSNPIKEDYFIDTQSMNMPAPLDDLILSGKDPKHQFHHFTDGTILPFRKINHVNFLLSRQEFVIDDKNNYKPLIRVFPRSSEKKYVLRRFANNHIRKKVNLVSWSKDESIFRQYIGDSEELLNECFEFDWSCSRITRFVKSEYERHKLREYFRNHYQLIKDVYKYYSSLGYQPPQFDIFCIQFPQFTKLVQQMNLIDGEVLKLQDLEIDLISIKNNSDSKFIYNPDKALVRFQFLEMFFRLANDKYIRTGILKNYADAVFRILKDFKLFFENFDSIQDWREQRYWNKECDYLINFKLAFLKKLYDFVTDITNRKWYFKLKWISVREFKEFCKLMYITDLIGEKQVIIIYNFSMITQVDELTQDRNIRMTFIEFVESLARLAERISPCPLGENIDNWSLNGRQNLPLHVKLETLLNYIYHRIQKYPDYELFNNIFSQDNPRESMPKIPEKRKGIQKEEEYTCGNVILSVFNTVSYIKTHKQPYLIPNYERFMRQPFQHQFQRQTTILTVPSQKLIK